MASKKSETTGLNPEPAGTQERADHDLPPKSYADAAHEAVDHHSERVSNVEDDKFKHRNGISEEDSRLNGHHDAQGSDYNGTARKSSHDTNVGKRLDGDKIIFEKYSNGDGSTLTSVKPDPSYEDGLKHNIETAPRSREPSLRRKKEKKQDTPQPQLQSGRRPGARWEQSAYVVHTAFFDLEN